MLIIEKFVCMLQTNTTTLRLLSVRTPQKNYAMIFIIAKTQINLVMKFSFFKGPIEYTIIRHIGRIFLCLLFYTGMSGSVKLFSQNSTPLTFTTIPYSDPDIISPGRGAEQWDNGNEKINNPVADTNIRPMDIYYRFPWTRLEGDSMGSYDWTHFDNIIKDAIDHRQKLSFGIMPVYDGFGTVQYDSAISAYPLYLHKAMQAEIETQRDWKSNGVWIPNWNSPHYLNRLRALHEALYTHIMASRYKNVFYKDAIYCIDIRGYGNYGEWHNAGIADRIEKYPVGRRATVTTLKKIIDHHTQVFSRWPLTIMIAAFDAFQFDAMRNPAELTYYALTTKNAWGPLGWRRDQWGATDAYLDKILKYNEKTWANSPPFKDWITTRYLTSPITGEPPNYVSPGGPCEYWDIERQLMDYGATSFGNGNFGIKNMSECGKNNIRAAFKRAGYRIVLEGGNISNGISPDKKFSINLSWKNVGIAPTYENWTTTFELRNDSNVTVWSGTSKFNPKLFAPRDTATNITDTFRLPASIPVSRYKLMLIIKDPVGYRDPLPLAITGRNADGSYLIKEIDLLSSACLPPAATIGNSATCKGQPFKLVLDSASGKAPYSLTINDSTYNNIYIGQTITTITPAVQTIWKSNPVTNSYEDSPVELGVKFKSSVSGYIKGIRFFSAANPSGIYKGHLWNAVGKLLDSVQFNNVTASGWQEALFTNPVLIKADTTYIASYHTSTGHYAATPAGLANNIINGSLTALGSSIAGGNGLFSYGNSSVFPTSSFNASNYWADVVFVPDTYTFNLTNITDSNECKNAGNLQTLTVLSGPNCNSDTLSPPVLPTAKISNTAYCAGQQSFNLVLDSATGAGPFDLKINGTTYNDIAIGQTIGTFSSKQQKIWDSIPSPQSYEDSPVELGVKFKSSVSGYIKGIRFFSSASPSGTYKGHLWNVAGKLLDSVQFGTVTASGWQEALFTTPIPIKADTIYIASYHTSSGRYSATPAGLVNNITNGSLTALGSSGSGGNGLFGYGSSPTFPTGSFNASNYWVDVLFTNDSDSSYTFHLTGITDKNGISNNGALQTLIVAPVNCDTIVAPDTTTAPVVLPTAKISNTAFCNGQSFNLVLDSASGPGPYDLVINGDTYSNIAVGQTITVMRSGTQRIWDSIPSPGSYEDGAVELGLKFKSSVAGLIKGIRFFSPKNASGKYTGHLWTAGGTLLDSVVFTNVTASGWQEALFTNPLPIKADTIYIASYHTASGRYSATPAGLVSSVTNRALTALGSGVAGGNGLYSYGASPTFPNNSFNATNYWVDITFVNDTAQTYKFNLTSVADSAGRTRTGDLQTLSVTSSNCNIVQGRPGSVLNQAPQNNINITTTSAFSDARARIDKKKINLLGQNYPNPFRNETIIQFSLAEAGRVNVALYDMNGKLVNVLVNGLRESGTHSIRFNSGALSSGIYFYKMQAGNFSAVKKMIIQ